MKTHALFLSCTLALSACGGGGSGTNPFIDATRGTNQGAQTETGRNGGSASQSSANMVLVLSEGDIQNPRYFTEADENGNTVEKLYVDNIPFDGVDELAYVSIADLGIKTSDGVGLFQSVSEVKDSVTLLGS